MLIKSQDGKNIYNVSQACSLYVTGADWCEYEIVAEFPNGTSITLGTYRNENIAREELRQIYVDLPHMGYHTMTKDNRGGEDG